MYTDILIGGVLGYGFFSIFSGKFTGDRIERSIRPKIGEYRLHIHHWLWCSAILIVMLLARLYYPLVIGILFGSIVQGLTFRDRFVVFYKDADFDKIYSKYEQ